jgi:hypothetical protein
VNTAIFSVIDSVCCVSRRSTRRSASWRSRENQPGAATSSVAYPDVVDWRANTHAFEEIGVLRRHDVQRGRRMIERNGRAAHACPRTSFGCSA